MCVLRLNRSVIATLAGIPFFVKNAVIMEAIAKASYQDALTPPSAVLFHPDYCGNRFDVFMLANYTRNIACRLNHKSPGLIRGNLVPSTAPI